jgi:hypothetical protein
MFSEADTAIFKYRDGTGERAADPQKVYRDLTKALKGAQLGGEGGLLDALQRGDDAVAFDAAEKLFPAVQVAFGLKPVQPDGTGCTERMQYRVLVDFLSYLDSLKKKADASPTS